MLPGRRFTRNSPPYHGNLFTPEQTEGFSSLPALSFKQDVLSWEPMVTYPLNTRVHLPWSLEVHSVPGCTPTPTLSGPAWHVTSSSPHCRYMSLASCCPSHLLGVGGRVASPCPRARITPSHTPLLLEKAYPINTSTEWTVAKSSSARHLEKRLPLVKCWSLSEETGGRTLAFR